MINKWKSIISLSISKKIGRKCKFFKKDTIYKSSKIYMVYKKKNLSKDTQDIKEEIIKP